MCEDTISNLAKEDLKNFFSLSYELLKLAAEQKDEKLIDEVLTGQVKPDILREIIASNKYNVRKGIVEPIKGKEFRITVGNDNNLL